jgi:hypothetical protein
MINNINYIGLEEDIFSSLKNEGFICKNERSDEYLCLYKKPNEHYDYGFLCESEITELMEEKSWLTKIQINSFLNFCDQTFEDFMNSSFIQKAYKLIKYFGTEDIMGKSFNDFTLSEACNLTNDIPSNVISFNK